MVSRWEQSLQFVTILLWFWNFVIVSLTISWMNFKWRCLHNESIVVLIFVAVRY